MCHNDGSGSQPPGLPDSDASVVSLCEHRRRKQMHQATRRLSRHIDHIHHRAVQVHNAVIERAGVSVLSELCRTAGVFLTGVEEPLRQAVLIPTALYGCSNGDIFGKKPLQKRIEDDIDDPEARDVIRALNQGYPAVWDFEPHGDGPVGNISTLGGPSCDETGEVAAMMGHDGQMKQKPGTYCGRQISFQGFPFVLFAHRLDECRRAAVRQLLEQRDKAEERQFWKAVELSMLRTIIDPDNEKCCIEGSDVQRDFGIRNPTSRSGLLLRIRRALWRHFAEPDEGLTLHAHIAALADDPEAFEGLVEEIEQVAETVTLKSGGLREGCSPVSIDEMLRPFQTDATGHLFCRGELRDDPVAVLLLSESTRKGAQLDRDAPIETALQWAKSRQDDSAARNIKLAWMTYCTEQNLVATYGYGTSEETPGRPESEQPVFARRCPVLPNLRTLFDPRFVEHTLADLDLPSCHQHALVTQGLELDEFTLADFERDERELTRCWGVGHQTTNAVRAALLQLGAQWRWKCCDLKRSGSDDTSPGPPTDTTGDGPGGCIEHLEEYLDD